MRAREIGNIGETIARRHLSKQGFELVKFGKEMHQKREEGNLPIVPDMSIGYSHGYFDTFSLYNTITAEWQNSDIPSWADIPYSNIKSCAEICKKHSECSIRDHKPKHAPCFKTEHFLEKDWLSSIYPAFPPLLNDENGNPIPLQGHRVVFECLKKILLISIGKHLIDPDHSQNNFILDNILVTKYIDNYYEIWVKTQPPLPYSAVQLTKELEKNGAAGVEKLLDINRAALKQRKFIGQDSYPGRYDFIGFKNGHLYAIEVKVNTSKLTYWQKVRLGCLQMLGYKVKIIQVTINKKTLEDISNGLEAVDYCVSECDTIDTSDVLIPTIEELKQIADQHYLSGEPITFKEHYYKLISRPN